MGQVRLDNFVGLRRNAFEGINKAVAVECQNLKPYRGRLTAPTPLVSDATLEAAIVAAGLDFVHPWPQIFTTRTGKTLVCGPTAIYTWNGTILTNVATTPGFINPEPINIDPTFEDPTLWVETIPGTWTYLTPSVRHYARAGIGYDIITQTFTSGTGCYTGHTYKATLAGFNYGAATDIYPTFGSDSVTYNAPAGPFITTITCTVAGGGGPNVRIAVPFGLDIRINTFQVYEVQSIPIGGPWQLADANGCFSLYNGRCAVIYLDSTDLWYCDTDWYPRTATMIRGRLIAGGFTSTTFWKPRWRTYFQALLGWTPDTIESNRLDASDLWWASINGGDNYFHHAPISMQKGLVADGYEVGTAALCADLTRRLQRGSYPIPRIGNVKWVQAFTSAAAAYGTEGVAALRPIQDPFPQFSVQPILDVGIYCPGACDGSDFEQVFVDTTGRLWVLRADFTAECLDYAEHLNLPAWADDASLGGAYGETITNGTFAAALTNWTVDGVGTYNVAAGVVTVDYPVSLVAGYLAQLRADQVAATKLVDGYRYKVTYTITSFTKGSVQVQLGSTLGTVRTGAGTFTEVLTCTALIANPGLFTLNFSSDTEVSIDNISVQRVGTPCVTVRYEPRWNEYYITGEDVAGVMRTHVLTEDKKLFRLGKVVIDVWFHNAAIKHFYETDDTTIALTTDTFDFQNTEQKTIDAVGFELTGVTAPLCSVGWRNSLSGSFYNTRSNPLNPEGISNHAIDAKQFRVTLTGDGTATTEVESMTIHYTQSGRKSLGGTAETNAPRA